MADNIGTYHKKHYAKNLLKTFVGKKLRSNIVYAAQIFGKNHGKKRVKNLKITASK